MNQEDNNSQIKSIFFPNWVCVIFAIVAWFDQILVIFHSDLQFLTRFPLIIAAVKASPLFIYSAFAVITIYYVAKSPPWALLFALYCFLFPFILFAYVLWSVTKLLYKVLSFFYSLLTREWASIFFIVLLLQWLSFIFLNYSEFNYLQIPSNLAFLFLFMLYQLKVAGDPLFWLQPIKWLVSGTFDLFINAEVKESSDIKKLEGKINILDGADQYLTKLEGWVKKLDHSLTMASMSSFLIVLIILVSIVIFNFALVYRVYYEYFPAGFAFQDKTISFLRWLAFSFAIFSNSSYLQFTLNSTYAYFLVVSETCFSIFILSFFLLNFSHLSSKSVEKHINELLELINDKKQKIAPIREKTNELKMKLLDKTAIEIEAKAVEKTEDTKRGD